MLSTFLHNSWGWGHVNLIFSLDLGDGKYMAHNSRYIWRCLIFFQCMEENIDAKHLLA